MKRAALNVLFVLSVSVFAHASASLDGNWIAGVNADDVNLPRVQVMIKSEDGGRLTGWIDHSQVRFGFQNGSTAGNSIAFEATELRVDTADTSPLRALSCSGVFEERTIDLNCQLPGGLMRRYVLTPHVGE